MSRSEQPGCWPRSEKGEKKQALPVEIAEEGEPAEDYEVLEEDAWEEPQPGLLKETLIAGCPQGFLTGCALYLCNYALMIGHWKIAMGWRACGCS